MQQSRTSVHELELESKLAGFVRTYIHTSQGGEQSQAEEALRWVCAGFEFLLGSLLDQRDDWRGWIDGIIPATEMLPNAVEAITHVDLTVHGQAIWGERPRGPFWIEPFHGSVHIAEGHDALVGYEVYFADAARGLATFPYGKHIRRPEWYSPTEWLFSFSKGTLAKRTVADDLT
jgi:hypothetical protein